jgi:deoxyribonuclease-4
MENSAGAGGTSGRSLDELAVIFDALGGHERLGICLGSCHLYVSGVEVADRGARDRHDNIGDGLIGDGVGVFLAHPLLQQLPVVLEIPGVDGKGERRGAREAARAARARRRASERLSHG